MSDKNISLKHLAIIMDGNRRWAKKNNLIPTLGHRKGAEVLENIAQYCNKIGIKYLTVYAFSTENWKRSKEEVGAIMKLLEAYLRKFLAKADLDNIKINIIGDLEDETMPKILRDKMHQMCEKTKNNTGLQLNIAFNYGGRAEILKATKEIGKELAEGKINEADITEELFSNHLYTAGQADPDLVIRTSGEMRTSNFLPWQITYSEFLFLDKYWPEFNEKDIDNAVEMFENRDRRIGK